MKTNKLPRLHYLFFVPILIFLQSCYTDKKVTVDATNHVMQGEYWNSGKAEISRYELTQKRYGSTYKGDFLTIFVREDFLLDKQVKNERYESKKTVPVLKGIFIRKFNTGIYDYSMQNAVFAPLDITNHPMALKSQASSQEWCGTQYLQANRKGNSYDVMIHSYFEDEADAEFSLKDTYLEEDLWNKLRMNPELAPVGEVNMLPAASILQLTHWLVKPYPTVASIEPYNDSLFTGNSLKKYRITTPELNRTLELIFENEPPFKIIGITDSYPMKVNGEPQTTIARLTHQVIEPYWKMNSPADSTARKMLGF
jgi:hypothetical protein